MPPVFRQSKKIKTEKNAVLVFLDSSTDTLIKRYSETRRPHPKFNKDLDLTLEDTIKREKEDLYPLKEFSDIVIDTSSTNLNSLKGKLKVFLEDRVENLKPSKLKVNFLSFGFKYGAPITCDLMFDLRFIPNPYYMDDLREKTGLDKEIQDFVLSQEDAQIFLNKTKELLAFLFKSYFKEGRAYLNIGIGCTGGRHRSVAIAESLFGMFDDAECLFSVEHRDLSY